MIRRLLRRRYGMFQLQQFYELSKEEKVRYFLTEIKNVFKKYYKIVREDFFKNIAVDAWTGVIDIQLLNAESRRLGKMVQGGMTINDVWAGGEVPVFAMKAGFFKKIMENENNYLLLYIDDVHKHGIFIFSPEGESRENMHIHLDTKIIQNEKDRKTYLYELDDFLSFLKENNWI